MQDDKTGQLDFENTKRLQYGHKQTFMSQNRRNKRCIFNSLRLWWSKISQWGNWLTDICFKRAGKVARAQLSLPHAHTVTHIHIQSLDPDLDSSSGNSNPHLLATNLPVPEADHILGALFSCGSLYILGLGCAVKNQVQCFHCFRYTVQLYASYMSLKLFFLK